LALQTVNKVQRIHMHGRLKLGVVAALLLLGAVGLAGCGVKGPLERPGDAPAETGNATPGTPGQPVPHKPSILDPIIR
jgi:predicted small lipoprotein YifL